MKRFTKILKCLGDQTRLRILKVIIESHSKLCVCEIVDSLNVPFYSVSKHLKELKNAEIVSESRDGTFIIYFLSEKKHKFMLKLIDAIKAIPDEFFKQDLRLLKKRLLLRENGKCVIGINTAGLKGL